jgi:hypothetical protein
MATDDAKLCKQDSADNRNHVTLTIPHKLKSLGGFNSGGNLTVIIMTHNTGSSTVHFRRKQKGQSRTFDNLAPVWSCEYQIKGILL